jgi:hypothetical protein
MGLFDAGGFYESFTPPSYGAERNALNPMIWDMLGKQMSGEPTPADWHNRSANLNAVRQQWLDANRATGTDYGSRGLGDSGWLKQAEGRLLGQRAGMESQVLADFWNNILARQMQATGQTGNYLAGARAGSGTYTQRT